MPSPFLDLRGDSILEEKVLGCRASSAVLLQNDLAVKTPLRYLWCSDSDIRMNIDSIQREQHVYCRLQSCEMSELMVSSVALDFQRKPHSLLIYQMENCEAI